MTTRANLIDHGCELTARHIKARVDLSRGINAVVIRDNGTVRIYSTIAKLPVKEYKYLIGTYGRNMPFERIQDDCICRLNELSLTPQQRTR